MFSDARAIPDQTELNCDLCVIGAGAAGITIARALAGTQMSVILAESGGLNPDRATNSLNRGSTGSPYALPLDESRARGFGGTTSLWAGWCRELDPLDFEQRDWVPESGWPFGHDTLRPFYERARAACEVDDPAISKRSAGIRPGDALDLPSKRLESVPFGLSPPTEFGKAYRYEIANSANVRTLLHATAVGLDWNHERSAIDRVRFSTKQGRAITVRARAFVLATGGIENVRLLLASSDDPAHAPGNGEGLVGRFYMDHPAYFSASLDPSPACPSLSAYTTPHVRRPAIAGPVTLGLGLSESTMRAERLLNAVVRFVPQPAHALRASFDSAASASARRLRRSVTKRDLSNSVFHLGRVGSGLGDLFSTLTVMAHHKLSPQWQLAVRCFIEPEPSPANRVTLSSLRGPLGERLPHVEWIAGAAEKRSAIRINEILLEDMAQAGFGSVVPVLRSEGDDWPRSQTGASHHMGTTRMHSSPRKGVVDADCRVHATANLYIAGSSVFPTCGYANPTLTIVALAYRLADRLHATLGL
jgi:choline dehydrogenase-like flavoprotein